MWIVFTTYYFSSRKGSMKGKADIKWNLSGVSFPRKNRRNSLSGYTTFFIKNGALREINFSNMLNSLFKQDKVTKKSPSLARLKLDEGFQSLKGKADFKQSKIYLNNIEIVGRKRGFNAKGKSVIDKDLTQNTQIDLYDPNGLLLSWMAGKTENPLALRFTGSIKKP